MDAIQNIMLLLKVLIERMKEIFVFISTQFLPMTDPDISEE